MVINVEYNQLDPLLRATGQVDGDVNDETGFSPFPGNINQVSFCNKLIISHHQIKCLSSMTVLSSHWFTFEGLSSLNLN